MSRPKSGAARGVPINGDPTSIEECYAALTCAVVMQAIDDYKKIIIRETRGKSVYGDEAEKKRLVKFFLNGDFERVSQTAIDPEIVLEKITKEAREYGEHGGRGTYRTDIRVFGRTIPSV